MTLTSEEKHVVEELQTLALLWPKSLKLFSWNGALHVLKPGDGRTFKEASVAAVRGIPNDGGDPNYNDIA